MDSFFGISVNWTIHFDELKLKIKYFLSFALFFTLSLVRNQGLNAFAQKRHTDSLFTLITADKSDTSKVNHLIALCEEYRNIGDYRNGLKYGNESLHLANLIAAQKYKAFAYNNLGNVYYSNGNYSLALKNYFASLKINEALKNKKDIAGSYINIGIIYYYQNNYSEALKNYYASLNLREQIGDKEGIANSYSNIGLIYDDPENYAEALKNFFIALRIYQEINDKKNIADSYYNIGRIYYEQENYSDALKTYFVSLKIKEEIGDKSGIAFTYNIIGNIYWNQLNYINDNPADKFVNGINRIEYDNLLNKALKNYFAALKIRKETGDKNGIIESLINLGNVQIELKKLKEAQEYFNKAFKLSNQIGSKEWIKESCSRLEELDSIQSNWKAAYHHHKLFVLYKDSIDKEELETKTVKSLINYDFEKKEASFKAEEEKKNIIEEASKNKKQVVWFLGSCVLILIAVLAGFIYRSRSNPQKNIF